MAENLKLMLKKIKSSKLTANYIWVFLGQNIGSVFSMLSLIVTLRIISTEEYGALVVIQTYATLISNIFCLRTFNGVIKYVTDAENDGRAEDIKKYIKTAFILDGFTGIISFVMGFLLLKPVTAVMDWELQTVSNISIYLPLVIFLPILNGAAIGVLRKIDKFKQVNIIHTIVFGLQLVLLALCWCFKIHNFKTVIFIYSFTEISECLAVFVYSLLQMNKDGKYKGVFKADFSKDISFIKFNFFYGLSGTFDQLLGNVSTLIINKYIGNLGTAYIKVITRICSLLSKLTNPFSQIIYPELCSWISGNKPKKAYNFAIKYFFIVSSVGAFVGLVMFGTYDWWINIFDAGMTAAKWQSVLYMGYTVLSIAIICINQCVFALNLVKVNMIMTAVLDVLYIIALIPSIKVWGIYGYLILQIVQVLCSFVFKLFISKRKIRSSDKVVT